MPLEDIDRIQQQLLVSIAQQDISTCMEPDVYPHTPQNHLSNHQLSVLRMPHLSLSKSRKWDWTVPADALASCLHVMLVAQLLLVAQPVDVLHVITNSSVELRMFFGALSSPGRARHCLIQASSEVPLALREVWRWVESSHVCCGVRLFAPWP